MVRPARARGVLLAVASMLVCVALGAAWFREDVFDHEPGPDFASYRPALEHALRGENPYLDPYFIHTPAFALVGGLLLRSFEAYPMLVAFRLATLASIWLLAQVSLAGGTLRRPARELIALALVLGPCTWDGLYHDNLSPLLIGPLIAGLFFAARRPLIAGLGIGLASAIKLLAVGALPVVVVPRRGSPTRWRWRLLFAAATAIGAAIGFSVDWQYLPSMFARLPVLPAWRELPSYYINNISVGNALERIGWRVDGLALMVVASGLGALLAWTVRADHRLRVAIGSSAAILSLPVMSPATFLFTVPIQVLALEKATARLRLAWSRRERLVVPLGTVALVVAGALSMQGSRGARATQHQPPVVQGLVTLIPYAALVFLTVYAALGHDPRTADGSDAEPTGLPASAASTEVATAAVR